MGRTAGSPAAAASTPWLPTLGDVVRRNAQLYPERVGAGDLTRTMTFRQWDERATRLANALRGIGLGQGDRVAVLAYNRVEWLEIYAAAARAGLIAVPINFRLVGREVAGIAADCDARAVIVEDALLGVIEEIRDDLPLPADRYVVIGDGAVPAGCHRYETLLATARTSDPQVAVSPSDPWALLYTSGTTGRPKGAIRSHASAAVLSLVTDIELGFTADDTALLVMPMCHANSLYFASSIACGGGTCLVYSRPGFDPEHVLATLSERAATFTSLVPTQCVMMLDLDGGVRSRNTTDRVTKLMVSSAPARRETKLGMIDLFPRAGLFELYGSTEQGWVTMLHPDEQLAKLGTVGRECVGSQPIRLLDDSRAEVADGDVGEIYALTPYLFDGYWGLPDKTAEVYDQGYCSVGDLGRRDSDGFLSLVDRKSNMIISGGENVYPSEVEAVLGSHPDVREAAVIGLPDRTWGERVHGVVVLGDGAELSGDELIDWSRAHLAGHKRPRSITVLAPDELPRTATGKIQHGLLKQRLIGEPAGR